MRYKEYSTGSTISYIELNVYNFLVFALLRSHRYSCITDSANAGSGAGGSTDQPTVRGETGLDRVPPSLYSATNSTALICYGRECKGLTSKASLS